MPARTPQDVPRLIIEALNAQDLEAALSLYEDDAILVPEPGALATGLDEIRVALADLLTIKPTGTIETKTIDITGDIALLHSPWTQVGTDEKGNEVSFSGITAEVVRQQPDGTWKYVIDDPWGGADR
jgi:uncharacterized protein (TIGR02246 family)